MNRKLLLLDFALAIGVTYGGLQLHSHWVAAKARQVTMPGPPLKPAPPPPITPLAEQPAVLASGYKKIALETLFDPSRNPDVVVPPPPAPPPPPPPPPLPTFRGMANFGDGPVAMMIEDKATRTKEVHAGEMIGAFKLLSFNRQEFVVEWNGKEIHSRLEETAAPKPRAYSPASLVIEPPAPGVIPGQAQEQPQQPPQPQQQQNLGPGVQVTDTTRACQSGDTAAAGTMSNGYQKVIKPNPLGNSSCFWTAIGK